MHQPRADRHVSFIGLSLTNGDPCPRFFDRAKGGARDRKSGRLPHSAPGLHTGETDNDHCASATQLQESTCRTVQPLRTAHRLLGLAWLCGARHNLQTTTYLKRYCRDETLATRVLPLQTRATAHKRTCTHTHIRQPALALALIGLYIGSLFSPLRFPPVRPARYVSV